MSIARLEEIKCPCGEVFEAELWSAINVAEDPDLKENLLAGEINVVCCPICNEIFYAEHFLLYHDPLIELIAFVYPSSFAPQASYWHTRMREDFDRAMEEFMPQERITYDPILLFGLDCLADIVREEEEGMDEIEILKHIAKQIGLSLIYLHPALARPLQLPRLLPCIATKSGILRDDILAGLRMLLQSNRNLLRYKRLFELIDKNKNWTLDDKIIKETLLKGSR